MVPFIYGRSGSSHMSLQYAGDTDVYRSDQTISQGSIKENIDTT